MHFQDVLVVPYLTKNLLSISKLTCDNPVDVLFSASLFLIQDRTTKQVIAQGKCDRGLYVLATSPKAYAFFAGSKPHASFELWHSRLGHVSFDTIYMLNSLVACHFLIILNVLYIYWIWCIVIYGGRHPFRRLIHIATMSLLWTIIHALHGCIHSRPNQNFMMFSSHFSLL